MKKLLLVAVVVLMSAVTALSQPFAKHQHAINAGLGFGNTAYWGSYYSGFFPSLSASYEYGIVEVPMGSSLTGVVSVGGYMGWSTSKYDYSWDDYYYRYNDVIIAARGNYHFIFHDKLDTYAGVWFGVDIVTGKWHGTDDYPDDDDWDMASTGPTGGAYVGARWFFKDNFAAYAELGYLISVFNIGVTYKIE
jgi:hypothetical protein